MPLLARNRFVADKQIQPAVAIEIQPGGRLRRMKRKEPRGLGNILERDVTAIAEQRIGELAFFAHPCAAQHKDIEMAVVVVIGGDQIQSTY